MTGSPLQGASEPEPIGVSGTLKTALFLVASLHLLLYRKLERNFLQGNVKLNSCVFVILAKRRRKLLKSSIKLRSAQ